MISAFLFTDTGSKLLSYLVVVHVLISKLFKNEIM